MWIRECEWCEVRENKQELVEIENESTEYYLTQW